MNISDTNSPSRCGLSFSIFRLRGISIQGAHEAPSIPGRFNAGGGGGAAGLIDLVSNDDPVPTVGNVEIVADDFESIWEIQQRTVCGVSLNIAR